jgi:hypothetical protein
MNDILRSAFAVLALGVLPVGFIATCVWLRRQTAWWFEYLAYFALFGTIGGWCFAISMSPGGIAAVSTLFLFSIAVVACVGSSVVLSFRKRKSRAEWIAIFGGYIYPGMLVAMMIHTFVSESHPR